MERVEVLVFERPLEELREWAKDECASYQFPRIMTTVEELPKNAMGKVNKKDLLRTFFA